MGREAVAGDLAVLRSPRCDRRHAARQWQIRVGDPGLVTIAGVVDAGDWASDRAGDSVRRGDHFGRISDVPEGACWSSVQRDGMWLVESCVTIHFGPYGAQ